MVFEEYLMTWFIQQTVVEQPLWARLYPGLWKQQGAAEVNCPGTSILFRETVKKWKIYTNRKRSDGDNKQGTC